MPKVGKKFKVVLKSDKDCPGSEQPFFEFEFLSAKRWCERVKVQESIEQAETGVEAVRLLFEVLKIGLVGWSNMNDPKTGQPIIFNVEKLQELLTFYEARELNEAFIDKELGISDAAAEKASELKSEHGKNDNNEKS